MSLRIGLVTCSKLPASAAEDELLASALTDLGFQTQPIVWDVPSPWREMDALVFRSAWNYHLHIERFDAWLDEIEAAEIPTVNSIRLVRWNTRKTYLLDLQATGVPTVETLFLDDPADACIAAARRGWPVAVAKPVVGASAHGVRRVVAGDAIHMQSGPFLLQPFVGEIETAGEWSLVHFDGAYSHSVRKRPARGDFRVQVEHGGHSVVDVPPPAVRGAAADTLRAVPERPAYARIDIVETAEGPKVMELELIEPELFLGEDPAAATRLAAVVASRLNALENHY